MKRHCGQVSGRVLADVERLLRQLRGSLSIMGNVSHLKRVLMHQGLYSSGPKLELVQRVYNCINLVRGHTLPMEDAEIAHVEEGLQTDTEGDDSDIVCVKCLSGEVSDGNDILICNGDHSSTVGYHQQCLAPPLTQVP